MKAKLIVVSKLTPAQRSKLASRLLLKALKHSEQSRTLISKAKSVLIDPNI